MPQINYETGRAGVQITPVQYNVQPNLSASRAVENLQKGILGALQLGGQIRADIKQENYETAALDQRKRHEAFQTQIAGLSYPQRKEAVAQFTEANSKLYDENTKFGRQLSLNEATFQGNIMQNLRTEGVEYEFLDNQTSQNNAFLAAKEKWTTATKDEKVQILKELEDTQVTPLLGFEDKYSKKLLGSAQTALSDFKITLDKEALAEANNELWGGALEAAVAHINVNGTMDAETRDRIVADKLGRISTYGEKGNELRQKFDDIVLNSILAKGKEALGTNPTYEGAQLLVKNLQDYAKVSPKVKGSDTYTKTLNAANAYVNAVNVRDQGSLNSLLVDDTAPLKAVETLSNALVQRGVLSPEDHSANVFRKQTLLVDKNVKPQIVRAYQSNDMATLGNLMKNGQGGQVATIVTGNLTQELAALANTEGMTPSQAIGQIMAKADTFAQNGIYVNKIEAIDNILKMPATGGIRSTEDAKLFVETMRQARKHNYDANTRKEVQADYAVLEAWTRAGIPDLAEKFQNYKLNPIKVKDEDVLKAYNSIVDNNEYFSADLTPANNARYRSALLPSVKALMKAGVETDTVVDIFEAAVETNFMEISLGAFSTRRVLMPRVGALNSEDVFKTVIKHFNEQNVLPVNVFEPEGDWMVMDAKTGKAEIYPFAAIEHIGKFGKLPGATPK